MLWLLSSIISITVSFKYPYHPLTNTPASDIDDMMTCTGYVAHDIDDATYAVIAAIDAGYDPAMHLHTGYHVFCP